MPELPTIRPEDISPSCCYRLQYPFVVAAHNAERGGPGLYIVSQHYEQEAAERGVKSAKRKWFGYKLAVYRFEREEADRG